MAAQIARTKHGHRGRRRRARRHRLSRRGAFDAITARHVLEHVQGAGRLSRRMLADPAAGRASRDRHAERRQPRPSPLRRCAGAASSSRAISSSTAGRRCAPCSAASASTRSRSSRRRRAATTSCARAGPSSRGRMASRRRLPRHLAAPVRRDRRHAARTRRRRGAGRCSDQAAALRCEPTCQPTCLDRIIVVNYNTAHLLDEMFAAVEAASGGLSVAEDRGRQCLPGRLRRPAERTLPRRGTDRELREPSASGGEQPGARPGARPLSSALNTDAFVAAGGIERTVRYLDANPEVSVLGARLVGRDGTLQPSCRYFPTPWNEFLVRTGLDRVFRGTRLVDDMRWDHASVRECDRARLLLPAAQERSSTASACSTRASSSTTRRSTTAGPRRRPAAGRRTTPTPPSSTSAAKAPSPTPRSPSAAGKSRRCRSRAPCCTTASTMAAPAWRSACSSVPPAMPCCC